jgi:hypothetical protein
MEKNAHATPARRPRRLAWSGFGAVLACIAGLRAGASDAAAAMLSPQELQIIGRAVTYLQPPPAGGTVAVVYSANDPASRQEADAIASEIGGGLQVGNLLLPARVVEANALAQGGFTVVIAASGANGPLLAAAVRAAHILCVTAELQAVEAGFCTMGISTTPRVEIVLNHAVAAASNITFAAAFRMMIHEM